MISSNSIHISDIYTKPLGGELERIEEENDEFVEKIDVPKKTKATKKSEKRNKVKKIESKTETNNTFKIIENDKKMKIKRETPGKKGFEQVSYIDPDRKIASSLGSNGTDLKDIGVEMTAGGAENELAFLNDDKDGENLLSAASNVLGRSFTNEGYKILLEQAIYEMTRGSYSVALQYLNKAVQINPKDPDTLIQRGACLVELQQFEPALKDMDNVFNLISIREGIVDCSHLKSRALVVKGKALYLQGNFEGAMVLYHRALHVGFASNIEEVKVRQIIDRATETIQNSLGTKQAASVFLLMPKMLKRMSPEELGLPWLDQGHVPQDNNISIEDILKVTAYPSQKPKVEKIQEKIDENVFKRQRKVLLGKLSNDLDYLEHLVNDVKIGEIHEHDKRGRIIRSEAQDAINFLEGRQEFWSQYKPMYSK